jgi:YD repeat-containing protein
MSTYSCASDMGAMKAFCMQGDSDPGSDGDDSCPVSDPVFPSNGNVTLSEQDYQSGDASPLTFTRTYLSSPLDVTQTMFGANWISNWQHRLDLGQMNASTPQIKWYRAGGQPVTLKQVSGGWKAPDYPGLTLTTRADGFLSLSDDTTGTTDVYDLQGYLYSETLRTGVIRKFLFDSKGRMVQINQRPDTNAPYVFKVKLEYDDADRVVRMTNPDGGITQYDYDSKGNLAKVTYPDGFTRQYLYEDTRFPHALTGLINEAGSRISTWAYDSNGRAISVSHPDSTRNASFAFGSNGTTVTEANGTTSYTFGSVNSRWHPTMISGPGGSVGRIWDTSGNLLSRNDSSSGANAQYTWDSAGRPTAAAVVVNGTKSVTTVSYNDATSLRPHFVATPGLIRAFVFDVNGNVIGYAQNGTTDMTGEKGLQAAGDGTQLTVGAAYDTSSRLLSATVITNGTKTGDWSYAYDATGNIGSAKDAVSGWAMTTISRDASNRATVIDGNTGEARITYDSRGRVSQFVYDEKASNLNGGVARLLTVRYGYTPDGQISSRTGTVATNGGGAQAIGEADLKIWISNWEFGAEPVSPSAGVTGLSSGLRSSSDSFVPSLCVECYVLSKAKLVWTLFSSELASMIQDSNSAFELKVVSQDQVPVPLLVPDLSNSAKRTMLYSQLFGGANNDGGMVKCGTIRLDPFCKKVQADCFVKCSDSALPTPAGDYGWNFTQCVNKCKAKWGC